MADPAELERNTFESQQFSDLLRAVEVPGGIETVVETNRRFDLMGHVARQLDGPIAVIGYASQGPAHANNLRTSLKASGVDLPVQVALREGSATRELAIADGFTEKDGTLITPDRAFETAAFVLMLIADGAMVKDGADYLRHMREGAVLGLAHGFYPGYLESLGKNIFDVAPQLGGVIGNCPKGMGPSVKKLYEMGSGINSSFAVEGVNQRYYTQQQLTDLAIAWGIGIGSPYMFQTTLAKEWRSDIFGERAILLGGIDGITRAVYNWKVQQGLGGEAAYLQSVESLVGPISKTISKEGLAGVFEALGSEEERRQFESSYNAAYPVLKQLMSKIYQDVSSGREIQEVVDDYDNGIPKPQLDRDRMARDGEKVRAGLTEERRLDIKIDPQVAGMYVAAMIAQVDVLRSRGHHWSEVVNESIIEAVDSLNPFMEKRGLFFMVDNCSDTAQRGDRKWSGAFEMWVATSVLPVLEGLRLSDTKKPGMLLQDDTDYFKAFLNHPVHKALETFAKMRPPISIAI